MKTIKNITTLLFVAFTISTSFAQSSDVKKLLVNKWVMDQEAMKPIIKAMLEAHPQIAAMEEPAKSMSIQQSLEQSLEVASKTTYEYKVDGTFVRTDDGVITSGTWSLSSDNKEITIKIEGKPEKKQTILELTATKLSGLNSEGKNLILKVAK